ncbi:MAG: aldo/keto reductase [Chloroflexi bacterium]|nr:aldo/keto reductase [Chloroflexota bacterium]MBV9596792.1 aldo/keto reductase [Chloroflexota bacterium]
MRYRTFGRTGLNVSTVSMGTNRLGEAGVDPSVWPPIVERALELGVNFFDTSISYNEGRSEAILGQVISRWPGPTVIATKGGYAIDYIVSGAQPLRDFTARAILEDIDGQLTRLRRDSIDMYMLHSPSVNILETHDWATAVDILKRQAKIRWFGISTSDHASGIWSIEHGADLLQIEYDLLNPTAEDELLPLAARHNVGIMARTPLARGLLTGKFKAGEAIPADQHWRRPRGDRLQLRLERVEQLRFLERSGQTLAQAALRFVLANPAVHCVVPGARTVQQLESNAPAADAELEGEELRRIEQLHAAWRAQGRW